MINKQELHDIFLKLRAGDTSQFELLYKNYKLLVYKIAFSILKNKETSEDVTQTVFTKIYSLKKEKLPSSKEATWLYAVTKNETISYYRKEKPNIALEEVYDVSNETECRYIQDIIEKEKYEKYKLGNEYVNKTTYILTTDNTRDKFAAEADRKITVNDDIPGDIYGILKVQREDMIAIVL